MNKTNFLSKNNKITLNKVNGEWEIQITYPDGRQISKSGLSLPAFDDSVFTNFNIETIELSAPEIIPGIPKYITQMKYIMDSEYSQILRLSDFEDRLNISKYRLCREFNDHFGISPVKYLTDVRINAAKTLLTSSDMKIYEIALNVGYDNPNHFINVFKKQTGDTPSEYRHKNSQF